MRWRHSFIAAALLAAAPGLAHAHLASDRFGDFYGGMLHPVTALEHLVPLMALGLLAGLQRSPVGGSVLLAAPLGLLIGAAIALAVPWLPAVPWVNKISFVVLGLLVAAAWRLPTAAVIALGVFFGLTHGYANGLAIEPGTNVLLFIAGVAASGLILVGWCAAISSKVASHAIWGRIAVRALGSWIAAIGLMVVAVPSAI